MEHPLKHYGDLCFLPFEIRFKGMLSFYITNPIHTLQQDLKLYTCFDEIFLSYDIGDVINDYLRDQRYFEIITYVKLKDLKNNPSKYWKKNNTYTNIRFYFKKRYHE